MAKMLKMGEIAFAINFCLFYEYKSVSKFPHFVYIRNNFIEGNKIADEKNSSTSNSMPTHILVFNILKNIAKIAVLTNDIKQYVCEIVDM